MHDPEMFPSPDTFRPERFLETSDPRLREFELPFGFGRRICVGMHLARNSLFISIARILWAFDILPARTDAEGGGRDEEILPDRWNFTNGFNSKPVSFPCTVKIRSVRAAEGVEKEWDVARQKLDKWQ